MSEYTEFINTKTFGTFIDEKIQTDNIQIVTKDQLHSRQQIQEALEHLTEYLRDMILRDNPKYRLKKTH
jgi:hypothetical protein